VYDQPNKHRFNLLDHLLIAYRSNRCDLFTNTGSQIMLVSSQNGAQAPKVLTALKGPHILHSIFKLHMLAK